MRIRSFFVTTVLSLVMLSNSYGQKMVGYVQSSTYIVSAPAGFIALNQIQWQKMTDVVFCFLNPVAGTTTGQLQLDVCNPPNAEYDFNMDKFMVVKSKCWPYVQNGPKLWIAIGGASAGGLDGARTQNLNTACSSGAARTALANSLVNFAILHELWGIDIDWEFPNNATEIANFSAFIIELRARIDAIQSAKPAAQRLKISVAVGGEYTSCGGHIAYFPTGATATNVINATDYFHIMAYDLPSSYGSNHSSLASGTASMSAWNTCAGIPISKMCLGIPFYGRPDPRAGTLNYASMPGGSQSTDGPTSGYYYNGSPTINSKIDAMRTITGGPAAGVVIWDIAQDKAGAESLLSIAYAKMFGTGAFGTNPCPYNVYVGRDTTKCVGTTLPLTATWAYDGTTAITTAGTVTFQWYKDGVSLGAGATSGTYNVPAAAGSNGMYHVAVTKNTCTVYDSVKVDEAVGVTSPSATNTTVCSSGPPPYPPSTQLSGTVTSGSIDWITASGAVAGSGNPLTQSPTTTTTYYARGTATNPDKRYFAGRPALLNGTAGCEDARDGAMTTRPEWVHRIVVMQPITIRRVTIHTSRAAQTSYQIVVMDATQPIGNPYYATSTASGYPMHRWEPLYVYPTMISNVNITLQPGTYYVGVHGTATTAGSGCDNPSQGVAVESWSMTAHPTAYSNVFSMDGFALQNNGTAYVASTSYGQLYDWRLVSAPLTQCARPSIVITHDCTLPVQLLDFFGSSEATTNNIFWNTASEEDNSHFVIERSADMTSFQAIGSVEGHGTTSQINHYKYIDHNPLGGANYYRLAQHDIDGKINYSNIIMIENDQQSAYQVSPNPFSDEITLVSNHTSEGNISVQVRNIQGAVVYQEQLPAGTQKFSVGSELGAGVYFVQVNEGSAVYTYKVVKQ